MNLDGVRVLDVSTYLAGPFAAMILADLGADVVKVERPPHGDDTRLLPPLVEGTSPVFVSVNRGKRSVVLDLGTPGGRDTYGHLVRRSDVVIDSFGPGVAERLRVDFDDLTAWRPNIVHCSVSAFGSGEIGSSLPGYDALVQAYTGMMSLNGEAGGAPTRIAASVTDYTTGMWAVIAILSALARRGVDDCAQRIETCLVDAAFTLMGHQVVGTLMTGESPTRHGSATPSAAPNEIFRVSDGWLMIATANDRQFERLCQALDLPDLISDSRFRTVASRVSAREELHQLLAPVLGARPVLHWCAVLGEAGVPVGPVQDLSAAIEDPLVAERKMIVETEDGHGRTLPGLRLPLDLGHAGTRRPPPLLGEHTGEVLREAGIEHGVVESSERSPSEDRDVAM